LTNGSNWTELCRKIEQRTTSTPVEEITRVLVAWNPDLARTRMKCSPRRWKQKSWRTDRKSAGQNRQRKPTKGMKSEKKPSKMVKKSSEEQENLKINTKA
jgi:hypothetical protein